MKTTGHPLVSVIITAYKRAALLEQAIDSVFAQTHKDWGLIVVDDNDETSPYRQETEAFMARYADNPKVTYLKHKNNRGASAARNTGIAHAAGRYVAFLDDDDAWLPTKLERQVARFAEGDDRLGLVYTAIRIVDAHDRLLNFRLLKLRGFDPLALFERNHVATLSSVMCTREALHSAGLFDEVLGAAIDWDLYIRVAQAYAIDYLEEPLTIYRKHEGEQITKSADKLAKAYAHMTAKYAPLLEKHKEHHVAFLLVQGRRLKLFGHSQEVRRKALQALRLKPFNKAALALWLKAGAGSGRVVPPKPGRKAVS